MKNNIKKTILTLIAIITLMSTAAVLPTYAALPDNGETVMPMWDNTAALNISIIFNKNGYGYAEGTVFGVVGVSKIVVDVTIYRQVGTNWIYVTQNQTTINSQGGVFSCPFPASYGSYYKAEYTIIVIKGGLAEVITKEKCATCEWYS